MPFFSRRYVLPFLLILISINTGIQWSNQHFLNTTIVWLINFLTLYCIWTYKQYYFHPHNPDDYLILQLYFCWLLVCAVRGVFEVDNYWDWKNLFEGSFALSLPFFVYVFSKPSILRITLFYWLRCALPLFCFFLFFFAPGAYHFYLGPILLLSCFLSIIPLKWRFLFICLLFLMLFADFGARSQVIKSAMVILMSVVYLMIKHISFKVLKIVHWFFYILPIILLLLGITGVFNVFQKLSENEGRYVEKKVVNGELIEDDLSADTRTFIYAEVIGSALKHHYVLWGRTPARGNDSESFGAYNAENLKTGKYERYSNEVCFTNIFTWLGLVGVILLSFIYLKSSYLAVYRSNNVFMKLLGIMIAFRWLYGWIEDSYSYSPMSIALWMMIAMGFSSDFRKMSNFQFKMYIRSIFR